MSTTLRPDLAFLLAAALLGCSRRDLPAPIELPPAAIATTSVSSTPPTASPSAVASTATGFAGLRERFPVPLNLSGPGVACSEDRCVKGQICCRLADARCLPADQEAACLAGVGRGLPEAAACDESSDCSAGQRCCRGRLDGDRLAVRCVPADRCDRPWDRPGGFGLPAQEVCVAGGRCAKPGTACVAGTDGFGECESAASRVTCGAAGLCPAERPWCFWDAAARTSECIPRGPWLREKGVLACDDNSDCPGLFCCAGNGTTFCSKECEPELAYAPLACRSAVNCYRPPPLVPSCTPAEDLPPGLGTCSWGRAP